MRPSGLSKNGWPLAIQVPGRDNPSLYPIRGGNAEGLMAKLDAARDRVVKLTGRTPTVTLWLDVGLAKLPSTRLAPCTRWSMHEALWQAGSELPDIS